VLRKWAITRAALPLTQAAARGVVSAVLSGTGGRQVAHVLQARPHDAPPTDFELDTVRRSCLALLQARPGLFASGVVGKGSEPAAEHAQRL